MTTFVPGATGRVGGCLARALMARGEPVELGRTHGSNAEARALLGFKPAYTMFDMVDEAVAAKAGAAR